jgi:2-dehydropantoate 2-reductase
MVASDKSGEAQMTELSSKYCIFGAGAIGGTIAAQLARADATVSVIARGETLAAIRKDRLRLLIDSETLQTAVRASADRSSATAMK